MVVLKLFQNDLEGRVTEAIMMEVDRMIVTVNMDLMALNGLGLFVSKTW